MGDKKLNDILHSNIRESRTRKPAVPILKSRNATEENEFTEKKYERRKSIKKKYTKGSEIRKMDVEIEGKEEGESVSRVAGEMEEDLIIEYDDDVDTKHLDGPSFISVVEEAKQQVEKVVDDKVETKRNRFNYFQKKDHRNVVKVGDACAIKLSTETESGPASPSIKMPEFSRVDKVDTTPRKKQQTKQEFIEFESDEEKFDEKNIVNEKSNLNEKNNLNENNNLINLLINADDSLIKNSSETSLEIEEAKPNKKIIEIPINLNNEMKEKKKRKTKEGENETEKKPKPKKVKELEKGQKKISPSFIATSTTTPTIEIKVDYYYSPNRLFNKSVVLEFTIDALLRVKTKEPTIFMLSESLIFRFEKYQRVYIYANRKVDRRCFVFCVNPVSANAVRDNLIEMHNEEKINEIVVRFKISQDVVKENKDDVEYIPKTSNSKSFYSNERIILPKRMTRSSLDYFSYENGGLEITLPSFATPIYIPTKEERMNPGMELFIFKGITLYVADLRRLNDGEFLSDNIINFYLMHLFDEKYSTIKSNIHLMSTHFYSSFKASYAKYKKIIKSTNPDEVSIYPHEDVKRWTKNVNIFKKEFIIIPIHQNYHWSVVIIWNAFNMFEDHDINVLLSKGIENPDSEVFDYYKTNLASLEEEEREKELAYQFYNQSLLESPDLYENSETVINLTDAEILNTPETSSTKQFRNRLDEIQDSFLNERLKDQDIEMEIIESRHPKQQCHMFYFDSLGGSRTCKSIFENLKTYLIAEAKEKYNINANSDYISTFNVRVTKIHYSLCQSPIQPNCYDCGVYLLKNIEQFFIQPKETCELILAMKAAGRSHTSRLDASNWFTHGDVSKKRQELYDLFRRKQKEHYSSRLTHMPTVDLSSEDVCIIED